MADVVVIDVHGFANLIGIQHGESNVSVLAAISNMAVHKFLCLVVHGNPAPSPWRKRFFLLAQQCFGATYEPLFLVRSWCFGCRKTKNRFETRLWLRTSTGTALVEKVEKRTESNMWEKNIFFVIYLLRKNYPLLHICALQKYVNLCFQYVVWPSFAAVTEGKVSCKRWWVLHNNM